MSVLTTSCAHRTDADDVVHRDVDLARVVAHVRRLPGRHHRHDDHDAEQRDQTERQEDLRLRRRHAREAEADRVRGADPVVEVDADRREPDEELPEPAPAGALPAAGDVDGRAAHDGDCRRSRRGPCRPTGSTPRRLVAPNAEAIANAAQSVAIPATTAAMITAGRSEERPGARHPPSTREFEHAE